MKSVVYNQSLMRKLWNETFELFRRHVVLWVPSSVATILMLALGRLQTAETQWLMRTLSTQHSVFGGETQSSNIDQVFERTMMITVPLGFLRQFIEVCFFVVALAATKSLVQMVIREEVPKMTEAVREVVPRYREALSLALKYMVVLGATEGLMMFLIRSPLTADHFHTNALSKVPLYIYGLAVEGFLGWLLMPSAIRLLRPTGSPKISVHGRQMGTIFAVATSGCALVLQFLIGKAETTIMVENQWEGAVIAVMNTLVMNAPQIALFIALALLAIQGGDEGAEPAIELHWQASDPP